MVSQILERIDFAELVSRRVSLTQTKKDSYKGLSPFTNEKTPSFFVNSNSKTWYDFSSGQGGGVIDYVMRTESLPREGALAYLADLVGVELEQNEHLAALRRVVRLSAEYFAEYAEQAIPYMASRGFSEETLRRYDIGYAPAGAKKLVDMLLAKGCERSDIIKAGMGYENSAGQLLSRYQNRVIFPIKDAYGTVVSFTGRATDDAHSIAAKYLHGSGTDIFRKKEIVWNLSSVRRMIAEHNMVIVCEGQLDALSVCEAGYPGVAILGASPSEEQMKLLAGASSNIYLVFDSDDAGEAGLLKSFEMAEKTGIDSVLYSINLPKGEDPNSFLQTHPKEAFDELILNAMSDTSAIIRSLIKRNLAPSRTRSQVASAVIRELAPFVQSRLSYRGLDLIERASQEFSLDQAELRDMLQTRSAETVTSIDLDKITFPAPIYERRILYYILDDPKNLLEYRHSGITSVDFESQLVSKVLEHINPENDSAQTFDDLREVLAEDEYFTILEFYSKGMEGSFSVALDVMKGVVLKRTRDAKNNFLGRRTPDSQPIRDKRRELRQKLKT